MFMMTDSKICRPQNCVTFLEFKILLSKKGNRKRCRAEKLQNLPFREENLQ